MPRDVTAPALPGLEGLEIARGRRPGDVDMSDAKVYTGAALFRDHPDVFKAVAQAIFIDRMSVRAIAARYRVSVNSVRAIRDMAVESATTDQGRAAFFIKSRASNIRGVVRLKALEAIQDRLDDPAEVADMTVDTLMRLAALPGLDDDQKRTSIPASAEIIDVDEFDSMLNGLGGDKKSAADGGDDGRAVDAGADDLDHGGDDLAQGADDLAQGGDDLAHGDDDLAQGADDLGRPADGQIDQGDGQRERSSDVPRGAES